MLLLPNDPGFYEILHSTPPPGWRSAVNSDFKGCLAVREGSLLLTPLTPEEEIDYLYGGEYDELEWLEDADTGS